MVRRKADGPSCGRVAVRADAREGAEDARRGRGTTLGLLPHPASLRVQGAIRTACWGLAMNLVDLTQETDCVVAFWPRRRR